MSVEIRLLDEASEAEYSRLLLEAPAAMFTHSLLYRRFLHRLLDSAQTRYLLAYECGELRAAIPAMIGHGPYGPVVNSLPFYGSHGGVISGPAAGAETRHALMAAFDELSRSCGALCSTLIESPLDPRREAYGRYPSDFTDDRIGQLTTLPAGDEPTRVEEDLLGLYHQKTRNVVRKALKQGFEVTHDGSEETIRALHRIHQQNIAAIGGLAKSWRVFDTIREVFEYERDYRVYTARIDGEVASALLVFFFNRTVEYFTPATLDKYRSQQPLSLLIHQAMRDAIVERDARLWNWGGTWLTQAGVYQIKSRWGTKDYPYRYHIRFLKERKVLDSISKAALLEGYPYFYTLPFSALAPA